MKERRRNGYEQREADRNMRRREERRHMTAKERKRVRKEEKRRAKARRARNKEFARVTYVFVTLFLVMMGYICYFNVVKSKDFINSPYNRRMDTIAKRIERGKILDKSGKVLAQSKVSSNGTETRVYPYGREFAHVVGYTAKGKYGLESKANSELLTSNAFFLEKIKNELQDKKNPGDNVVTTLDVDLQKAAYNALGDQKGAVVVMEPKTGKVRAMVSKPDFDPDTVEEQWANLNEDTDARLLNRATQGQYPPGSTFKVVTALEYIREHGDPEDYSYVCNGQIDAGTNTIHCLGGTVHGQVNFRDSLAYSCNTSFSNIGEGLNVSKFTKTTKNLLFDSKLPGSISYKSSHFDLSKNAGIAERMMTAIGQGKTQVSPYHMALITAAIANNGKLMKPYLIDSVTNYQGSVISSNKPEEYKRLMTADEASMLKDYMSSVTKYGTAASAMSGTSYSTAGKTGTAEYSSDKSKDHSWFIGMSNVDDPDLVISVIIEAADGNAKAVNVARQVFDAYYE